MLPVLRRLRPATLWAVVVAAPLLIVALWPGQRLLPEESRWWFTQIFPVVRSLEFWMGMAAAELMRRGRWRGPGLTAASLLFVATWAVTAKETSPSHHRPGPLRGGPAAHVRVGRGRDD
ncbi:hypothetical protein OG799_17090 [Micromonospora sp. NBC_00898]|nr:hypothetical protein OG799_17090 [Micromonospora sp. NBC_00898]